jgi:hypothetical protein
LLLIAWIRAFKNNEKMRYVLENLSSAGYFCVESSLNIEFSEMKCLR